MQAKANAEVLLKQQAIGRAQADANQNAQVQRQEEERRHKDKMKLYEEKLKEKEAELKKMDDAKRAFEVKRIQEDDQ